MLVEKVAATVSQILRGAGLPANGIDTIFFTGGSSGIPLLRRRIAALLPQARVVEGDLFGSIGAGSGSRCGTALWQRERICRVENSSLA
jgi:hypothetical chaperone protein